MKTYIFADRSPAMKHFEIAASTPAEAVRLLVAKHGIQSYRIVNIINADGSSGSVVAASR